MSIVETLVVWLRLWIVRPDAGLRQRDCVCLHTRNCPVHDGYPYNGADASKSIGAISRRTLAVHSRHPIGDARWWPCCCGIAC